MTQPIRIQLSRAKGWRIPENTVVVSRPSKWGNPFIVGKDGTQEHCVDLFTARLCGHLVLTCKASIDDQRAYPVAEIHELAGKNLGCWCRLGTPCHADVLLELANKLNRAKPLPSLQDKDNG